MLTFDRWAFPDGERHLPQRMRKWNLRVDGRLTYQYPLYQVALKQCRQRRVAVDVGAHIGLFSYWMVRDFEKLVAFEPVEAHRLCWLANVPKREGDVLYPYALGARAGSVALETPPGSTGGTHIVGQGPIAMHPLDSFDLTTIDLLKIDCEGFEAEVVAGAAATLARCRPVVAVEQRAKLLPRYHHGSTDAVRFLEKLGARLVWTDRSDYVLVFP